MTERFCELHNLQLIEGAAPIIYGTVYAKDHDNETEVPSKHPFANAFVYGSCWVEKQTHANVHYCPTCREICCQTPAGVQLTAYLAGPHPALEEEIATYKAEETKRKRYEAAVRIARVVIYVAPSSAICAVLSYALLDNWAMGCSFGGIAGVLAASIINYRSI